MKNKLVTRVKSSKLLYNIYFFVMNFLIGILKLFVKPDDNLILINSFGGKKYDDSPKELYEAMLKDERFQKYRFVWAFHEPDKFDVQGAEKIKSDTLTYFKTALKARCWISNSGIERGLSFKGREVFYFNTWHGTPIKKMGSDISGENKSFKSKAKKNPVDIMTAQSDFEADIFSRVFNIPRENFLMCGLPRNDILANYTNKQREEIKAKLGLPKDKKVILYAPTFREFERDSMRNCVLKPPMNLDKWECELGDEYCLLFRAHYEVGKIMNISDNEFVRNMTTYPNLNELMIVADVLVSDYSSIFFDFSIMDKPMLHFTYDYEAYSTKRGMYFDIRDELSGSDNEDGVIELIKCSSDASKTIQFRNNYVNYFGSSTSKAVDCIYKNIKVN